MMRAISCSCYCYYNKSFSKQVHISENTDIRSQFGGAVLLIEILKLILGIAECQNPMNIALGNYAFYIDPLYLVTLSKNPTSLLV